MVKKLTLAALLVGLLLATGSVAFAGETGTANTLAVCGCGKVFTPGENTKQITVDGKTFACCSEACHEKASQNPEMAAKMAQANLAKLTDKSRVDLSVGNVVAVTDEGTRAVCGCGKHFTVGESTPFLKVDGDSYACCGEACHKMAKKNPEAAVKKMKEHLAKK